MTEHRKLRARRLVLGLSLIRRVSLKMLGLVLVFWSTVPSSAQVSVMPGGEAEAGATIDATTLTPGAVDAMVSRLTDEQVRAILLERLNAEATTASVEPDGADFGDLFYHVTIGAFGQLLGSFAAAPSVMQTQGDVFAALGDNFGDADLTQLLTALAIAIVIGLVVEWLVNRAVLRWLPRPDAVENPSLSDSVTFLARRLAREVLGVVVFYIVARVALHQAYGGDDLLALGDTVLFALITFPRLTYSVSRFALSPKFPEYRMVHADDTTARFLSGHFVGLAVIGGLAATVGALNILSGVDTDGAGLGFWLDLIFRLYLIWIIWRSWNGLVLMMRGSDTEVSSWEDRVARAYPAFAITLVIAMWWLLATIVSYDALHLLDGRGDLITIVLLLLAPALDTLIRGIVHHFVPPISGEGGVAERAYAATKASYKRIGRVIVFGLILVAIADAWGITTEMLASAGAAGRVIEAFFGVFFVLALGYVTWEVSTLLINRKLAAEIGASGVDPEAAEAGEIGGAGATRLSTVLPLFRVILQTAIIIVFGLITLSELGIDTTPLLAGAGIAGLAIGFGAQKLVTDVVSGAFFLIDDAFRMGEYIETGSAKGTVEKISIRSMQLRHHNGPVYTLPYGEVSSLKNMSRDWGIMKLPFIFPFDADPERIRKIFKKVGQDLLEHPEYGEYFIQPFKSQGVLSIDDVGMTIRGKFMAKPGKQFEIRKEIFNRVRAAVDEAGIPFARREVRVALPDLPKDGDEASEQAAKAAASAAAAAAVQASETHAK